MRSISEEKLISELFDFINGFHMKQPGTLAGHPAVKFLLCTNIVQFRYESTSMIQGPSVLENGYSVVIQR